MAQIFLSQVGQAVGTAALGPIGGVIGRLAGAYAGARIDQALFAPDVEGPRLKALALTESREGVGLPLTFGRMRVPGQVIWASHFIERREEVSTGGKGGPEVSQYRYAIHTAVALCEGVVLRVDRAWANGQALDLSGVTHRLYRGEEGQLPDPLIEAIEGAGRVPAYRGTAYIVFEDFALDAYGGRLPQLSFEVERVPQGARTRALGEVVKGVNLIPGSGEFVYATTPVFQRWFPGIERPENVHGVEGRADMLSALDQMAADLPELEGVSLISGWFGTAERAGVCAIRPGVEAEVKDTVPWAWRAGGVRRDGAHRISRDAAGALNYGGSPDDRTLIEGIRELAARGYRVTLVPFLFMDTAGLPWRGRLSTQAADGTAGVRAEIAAFMGEARPEHFTPSSDGWSVDYLGPRDDWGYRRFVLQHAQIARMAGGVESVLIGSEMVGLTRLRDETGGYPFVAALVSLAREVKAMLGPGVKVSYAADWTEYGAHVPGGTGQEVGFPLDALWADPAVDFVGLDWYPPMGDWRDGAAHPDARAGWAGPEDPGYLASQIAGGEGYDWFYASAADRLGQVRTPITDGAYGEPWVFRVKDLRGWWGQAHHPRTSGVRAGSPTAWVPGMKPVRFCEIGFPAVDRGTNQPNVFYDPKSVESALPHFSRGLRDDGLQRAALAAVHDHWFGAGAQGEGRNPLSALNGLPMVEEARVWAFDARPWPDFPVRTEVWADGPNWSLGHWLNGRAGFVTLGDVVGELAARGGVVVALEGLDAAVDGYGVDQPMSVRASLEPLALAYGLEALERDGGIVLRAAGVATARTVLAGEIAGDGEGAILSRDRRGVDKAPDGVRLAFIDAGQGHEPGVVEVREGLGPAIALRALSLPLVMEPARARELAVHLLGEARAGQSEAGLEAGPSALDLEPGDRVQVEGVSGGPWRVEQVGTGETVALALREMGPGTWPLTRALSLPVAGPQTGIAGAPDLLVMDLPVAAGAVAAPVVAVFRSPWSLPVRVESARAGEAGAYRGEARLAAVTGVTLGALEAGPVGRWDEAGQLSVRLGEGRLASVDAAGVLNGANRMALATPLGWEVIGFRNAVLQTDGSYRLGGLLRGLSGSDRALAESVPAGARCVLIDGALAVASADAGEIGQERQWRAGGSVVGVRYGADGARPWRVAHLRAVRAGDGSVAVSWIRRGADVPDDLDAPDPVASGVSWRVRFLAGEVLRREVVSALTGLTLPAEQAQADGADRVEVAEIGTDGRDGPIAGVLISA